MLQYKWKSNQMFIIKYRCALVALKPVNRKMLLWQRRESGNCNNASMNNHNDAWHVHYPDLNDFRCPKRPHFIMWIYIYLYTFAYI